MGCKVKAEAVREFGDVVIHIECIEHGPTSNGPMVVPESEIAEFLALGSVVAPRPVFDAVVKALNDIGIKDAAIYLPN